MDGRIFGLDIQLGFDVIFQAIAVFIMFGLLSYLLFEPVRKLLENRKNKIAGELDPGYVFTPNGEVYYIAVIKKY